MCCRRRASPRDTCVPAVSRLRRGCSVVVGGHGHARDGCWYRYANAARCEHRAPAPQSVVHANAASTTSRPRRADIHACGFAPCTHACESPRSPAPRGFNPLLEWSIRVPTPWHLAPANRVPFDAPSPARLPIAPQRLPAPVRSGCRRMCCSNPHSPSRHTPICSRRHVGLVLPRQPRDSVLDDRSGRARSLSSFHQPDERKGVGK